MINQHIVENSSLATVHSAPSEISNAPRSNLELFSEPEDDGVLSEASSVSLQQAEQSEYHEGHSISKANKKRTANTQLSKKTEKEE